MSGLWRENVESSVVQAPGTHLELATLSYVDVQIVEALPLTDLEKGRLHMPRWALGAIAMSPLSALLGQGKLALAVQVARESFMVMAVLMSLWLVVGFNHNRKAL